MEKKIKEENKEKIEKKEKKKLEKQTKKENKKAEKQAKKEKKNIDKQTKKENKKNGNYVKLGEKISLNFRKKWLINGTRTVLLCVILILTYIILNLVMPALELPEIDVTESKIYSLSDDSKRAIEKVDQDIKIYAYGFEENSTVIKFLKKYNAVNEKITYEILTETTNMEKIKENELKEGYMVLIFESGDSKKVVDASTEFYTYDYTTSQEIDVTEQAITNAILSLLVENKPKVYFTEGHKEFSLSTGELTILQTYLTNESFEMQTINLATTTGVPDDCDVLAIMSPTVDFYDIEREYIIDYISKGGKIYFSLDPLPNGTEMPNIKTILSQYGVSVQNGQIFELKNNQALPSAPNVFKPQMSPESPITADIYSSKGEIWLAYAARLQFESEETLTSLKVTRENLLASSNESIFVTDLSADIDTALQTAETGASIVSAILTKNIGTVEGDNAEQLQSVLIVTTNGNYISDYIVESLSSTYPLSYIGNNKDFAINCLANLADKEGLTIRKEITSQGTYIPSDTEGILVLAIVFGGPILIVLIGMMVWYNRKKRK